MTPLRRSSISVAPLIFILGACTTFPEHREVAIDHGAPPNFASDKLVTVQEFRLETDARRYDGPPDWVGVEVAQEIAAQLRRKGVDARAVDERGDDGAIRIRGKILRLDGGSKAARNWAPGAGGAWVGISGEALSADGERIGRFSTERRSARGGSYLRVVEHCVQAVAEDVARMVTSNRYEMLADEAR